MNIHLASKSETRAKLLKQANIEFTSLEHGVDENEVKVLSSHLSPTNLVVKLAELKATQPTTENENDLVIGADQVLDLEGKLFNKAKNKQEAREQLKSLNGKTHKLITSTIIAQNKKIIWRHLDVSNLQMRNLNEGEIENYLNNLDDKILNFIGVYAIEQEGIKLFKKIEGDFFSIQGISLLPLINFLWENKLILNND
jgi:septum formation protein